MQWDPQTLYQAISLPVHEVLESAAPSANIQDLPDGVSRSSIHDPDRRSGDRADSLTGFTREMVYSHGGREPKSHCRQVNHPLDFIGTLEPWCQLASFHPERKILGRQPDPLPWMVARSGNSAAIGL